MNIAKVIGAFGAVTVLSAVNASEPEEDIFQVEGTLDEVITSSPEISSPMIAGLIAGPMTDRLDYSKLRFSLPVASGSTKLCYWAASRDGVVRLSGTYAIPAGKRVVTPPKSSSIASAKLATYNSQDVAVTGRIGSDCQINPAAAYVPAAYQGKRETLHVMLLSRNATAALIQIKDSRGAMATAQCTRSPGKLASIRFDMSCAVPLTKLTLSGASTVTITLRDRRGNPSDTTAKVVW